MQDRKLNPLHYFLLFLAAGLVDLYPESLNSLNAPLLKNWGKITLR